MLSYIYQNVCTNIKWICEVTKFQLIKMLPLVLYKWTITISVRWSLHRYAKMRWFVILFFSSQLQRNASKAQRPNFRDFCWFTWCRKRNSTCLTSCVILKLKKRSADAILAKWNDKSVVLTSYVVCYNEILNEYV